MSEPWWKSAVVYQVYPRSFADADGDGVGDLRGVLSKLDYLAELGVDAVWLSPFFTSPQHDNGYDVSNYQDVDPLFGTLGDVDELIAGLHARNMKLIIDVIVNHTSDEHPWFVESRQSADNPKRDWFWWRPPRPGREPGEPGAEPTNWISYFSEPSWSLDDDTGEYYLHLFSKHQPDLNWENPEVRHAVYDMLRWWLDRGVDGFRMDVINLISKTLPLEDGPLRPGTSLGDGAHNFVCGPRIHEFLHELHDEVIAGRGKVLITVGEMPSVTVADAVRFTDPDNAELDMVFQFEHVGLDHGPNGVFDVQPVVLADLRASLDKWQAALTDRGWNSLYWNNHDQPRAVSRFGSDDPVHRAASAKLLGSVLHLQRGTPYIYQGEELGMTNFPFSTFDQFVDIQSTNYRRLAGAGGRSDELILDSLKHRSRDNARTPMQWTAGPHAGFTTGEPWMEVNPNHREINAETQRRDPDSVFAHYQRLIALRHELPVVAHGDYVPLQAGVSVYAYTRSFENESLLVIANFGSAGTLAELGDIEAWGDAELLLSSGPTTGSPLSPQLLLRPWECRVYHRS